MEDNLRYVPTIHVLVNLHSKIYLLQFRNVSLDNKAV